MKAKTTDQKIRLSVDVLEKLKEFAIQVSVHRKKQTTWTDLLRHAAQRMGKGNAEGTAKSMDGEAGPAQSEPPKPTHDKPIKHSVVISEDYFQKLAKLAQDVSARGKPMTWVDVLRFAIFLLFANLDAQDIAEKLDEYPKFDMSPTQATNAK